MDFWARLDTIISTSRMVVDRPTGSRHPRYPSIQYPIDYGYLDGVGSSDGGDLDVWRGSLPSPDLVGIVCTSDTLKRDSEVKMLLGCTDKEVEAIERFHTNEYMSCLIVRRPEH